jgi:RNA polymerase sigma factor (sigma-70 family)
LSTQGAEAWRSRLANGDPSGAWDLFIDRYRPLIMATVRRTLPDPEDRMEAFAHVCEGLAADELARLRRFQDGAGSRARFSTWLVTVVHHQLVDWLRQRDGRPRLKPPRGLTKLQQRIFTHVFVGQRSHSEAYELVRAEPTCEVRFSTFLRELAEIYRIIEQARPGGVMHYLAKGASESIPGYYEEWPENRLAAAAIRARLAPALATLSAEDRVALRLYVIERVPARDVARVLGWSGPKTVYNRVYRNLMQLRGLLEAGGVGPGDF